MPNALQYTSRSVCVRIFLAMGPVPRYLVTKSPSHLVTPVHRVTKSVLYLLHQLLPGQFGAGGVGVGDEEGLAIDGAGERLDRGVELPSEEGLESLAVPESQGAVAAGGGTPAAG